LSGSEVPLGYLSVDEKLVREMINYWIPQLEVDLSQFQRLNHLALDEAHGVFEVD